MHALTTGTSTNVTSLLLTPPAKTWDIADGSFCTQHVYFRIRLGCSIKNYADPDNPNGSGCHNRIRPMGIQRRFLQRSCLRACGSHLTITQSTIEANLSTHLIIKSGVIQMSNRWKRNKNRREEEKKKRKKERRKEGKKEREKERKEERKKERNLKKKTKERTKKVGCCQHLMSYQNGCRLVSVCIYGYFIVLPHWQPRLLAP